MRTATIVQTTLIATLIFGTLYLFNTVNPEEQREPKHAKKDCSVFEKHEQSLTEKYRTNADNLESARQSMKQMLKTCERQNKDKYERRVEREAYCLETDPALLSLEKSIENMHASAEEMDKLLEKASQKFLLCKGGNRKSALKTTQIL